MPAAANGDRSNYLSERHDASSGAKSLPGICKILIIEDNSLDAERLKATLHIVLSRDRTVDVVHSLGTAVDNILSGRPNLVFLDDFLKPSDTAVETIPFLRRAGYEGHIIIVSGELDRQRRQALRQAGATTAIHKDDINSARVAEALAKIYGTEA